MTRIFQAHGDVNNYQQLMPDVEWTESVREQLRFKGQPKADTWDPPPVYSPHPTLKAPDIWWFQGCMAFPPIIVRKLGPILYLAGELLPLPFDDETLLLLNLTPPVNCLDEQATDWATSPSGQRLRAKKLAFLTHRVPATAFRVPETAAILCPEGLASREDEFKATVEDLGLTGLFFELHWGSENLT